MVIAIGWGFINPANHTPFIPEATTHINREGIEHAYGGIMGILGAAGVVFFAYIGFDAVSTAAQEAKNPKRDMPIGILGSLVICTVLYILFAYVLSGLAPVEFFRDPNRGAEASVAAAITTYMPGYGWLSNFVTVAILAGFSSVILVMLLGQSRVFYSMSRDGLVPKVFSDVHPTFKTPYKSNMLFFVFTSLFAAFIPDDIVGRDDEHRHAVRVHAGVRRRLDHARAAAGHPARLHGAGAAGRGGARHRRVRRDDLRAGLDQLAPARRVAGDRPRDLLRLQPETQPARHLEHWWRGDGSCSRKRRPVPSERHR